MRHELFHCLVLVTLIAAAGCSGDGGSDRVEAQVLSGFGMPVGFAQALVSGKDEVIEADEDGRFSFSAGGSYDVAVLDPNVNVVTVFMGLHKRHPKLILVENGTGALDGSVVIPTLGGATSGTPTLGGTFIPGDLDTLAGGVSVSFSDTIVIHPGWRGPETQISGTAALLQFQRGPVGDRRPVAYYGHADLPVTITAFTVDTSLAPVTLQPVTESELTLTQSAPPGFTPTQYSVLAYVDALGPIQLGSYTTTSASITWKTPDIEGYTFRGIARARDAAGTSISSARVGLAPDEAATFTHMTTAAVLESPADGEVWTPVTPISWTASSDAEFYAVVIHDAAFQNGEGSYPPLARPSVQVVTSETTLTLPDLSPLGIDIPTDRPYQINLSSSTSYEDIDAYATVPTYETQDFLTSFSSIVVNP